MASENTDDLFWAGFWSGVALGFVAAFVVFAFYMMFSGAS